MKLTVKDNQLEIVNDVVSLTDRELFIKAMINVEVIHTLTEQSLYNPLNIFSSLSIQYNTDAVTEFKDDTVTTVYSHSPEQTYKKFENIYKIVIANIILQSYKYVLDNVYSHYVPTTFFGDEFDKLDLIYEDGIRRKQPFSLSMANSIIYTTTILKLFEKSIQDKNKRKEYKESIKKVLKVFCENSKDDWQQISNKYIKQEYQLPIQKLYFLLSFYHR